MGPSDDVPRRSRRAGAVRWTGVAAAVVLAVAAGCSNAGTASSGSTSDVPATASGDLLATGAQVYATSCALCHGANLRGTERGPSQLSEVYRPGHHPDASYRSAIERGAVAHHWDFGDMPPVPGLSPADVDAVIAYIRAEQVRQGFEPYPP